MITDIKKENEMLIEEMLNRAEKAKEPGTNEKVIHRGDEETPPSVMTELKSAGYVYLYETTTGERSTANRNMLLSLLRIKNPDGNPRFTTQKPSYSPHQGTLKCLLHPGAPNRTHYNELGLPVCKKSNITAPYMVEQHMKKRHPSAWATIEKERTDRERQEDRDLQKLLIQSATNRNSVPTPAVEAQEQTQSLTEFKCKTCGKGFPTLLALTGHNMSHNK